MLVSASNNTSPLPTQKKEGQKMYQTTSDLRGKYAEERKPSAKISAFDPTDHTPGDRASETTNDPFDIILHEQEFIDQERENLKNNTKRE